MGRRIEKVLSCLRMGWIWIIQFELLRLLAERDGEYIYIISTRRRNLIRDAFYMVPEKSDLDQIFANGRVVISDSRRLREGFRLLPVGRPRLIIFLSDKPDQTLDEVRSKLEYVCKQICASRGTR